MESMGVEGYRSVEVWGYEDGSMEVWGYGSVGV
jgi:hypothetical protein